MKLKKEEFLNQLDSTRSAVLVGPLLKKEEALLIPNSPLLLVDGGKDLAIKYSLDTSRSCFSIGDGDSSKSELDQKIPKEKDYSDLAYALSLMPKSVEKIELFGFLGGRADHELCNFGEIFRFLKKKNTPAFVKIGPNITALNSGKWNFKTLSTFSLVSLEDLQVKLSGEAAYQLKNWTKIEAYSSHGLSNEGRGQIELEIKSPAFLYGEGITFNKG